MKSISFIPVVLMLAATFSSAQAPADRTLRFQLMSGSAITIVGTSTVSSFRCTSNYVQGFGTVSSFAGSLEKAEVVVELAAQVTLFDCGNGRMNRDLWSALKSDTHPLITYRLDEAIVEVSRITDADSISIQAAGKLTIAGVERPINLVLSAVKQADGMYIVTGQQDITMSEFEVDRPTALLGLVKAHDDLTIYFDLKSTVMQF